jgi:hypothetical protein
MGRGPTCAPSWSKRLLKIPKGSEGRTRSDTFSLILSIFLRDKNAEILQPWGKGGGWDRIAPLLRKIFFAGA